MRALQNLLSYKKEGIDDFVAGTLPEIMFSYSIQPHAFSREHLTEPIFYDFWKDEGREQVSTQERRLRIQKGRIISKSARFEDKEPPRMSEQRFTDEEQKSELLGRIKEAFKLRPVWLKNSLLNHIQAETEIKSYHVFKKFLAALAFNYKDGPWKYAYTKFGYDPRLDPAALRYQIISIGVRKDADFRSRPRKEKNPNFEMYDPTGADTLVKYRQLYQICDVEDERVQKIIEGNIADLQGNLKYVNRSCTKEHGWLDRSSYRQIFKCLKERMKPPKVSKQQQTLILVSACCCITNSLLVQT
eukprot:TRINITY_DN2571_c0_g1_i1.p1 TRINITY_DN2571_c0_g1~~TRINITY_DN2571_c0_g1_i1.p1  ORF type:complete len:301 (+),score=56.92 TRINITY_DN2571_c0_g1_i1:412-1314(+)